MKFAYQRLIGQVILIASSLLLILILPVLNLVSINAAIVTTTMTSKLYWEIRLRESPRLKDWSVSLIKTVFWVSTFYILYVLAGMVGLWGFLLLTVALAAWRIYQGRELFDTYTAWAADRAWGRTKENFDVLEELTKNEQGRSTGVIREDTQGTSGQDQSVKEESSSDIGEQQHLPASETIVQEVPQYHTKSRKSRTRSTQRKTLPVVPEDMGTRKQVKP